MPFNSQSKIEIPLEEKRKYPRIQVFVSVSFDCYDDDNEIIEQNIGTILDISEGGLLLESDNIVDANYVKLVIIGFDNDMYSIVGSAVHSRKLDSGKSRTGICFHGSSKSNLKFLAAVIRTYFYFRKAL